MKIELDTLRVLVPQPDGKRIFPEAVDVVLLVYDDRDGHKETPLDQKAIKVDDHYLVDIPTELLDRLEGGWVYSSGRFERVSDAETLLKSIRIIFPWPKD